MNLLIQSKDPLKPLPGYNMPISRSNPPSITEIFNAKMASTKVPEPADVYHVPAYACPDYTSVVGTWQAKATQAPTKANKYQIKLEEGSNVREETFGQVKMGANGGFSSRFLDILAFGSSDEKETTLNTEEMAQSLEIEMFWDDMAKVTVSPGNWNVGNPRGNYPKLKDGHPTTVEYLGRPSTLLLVSKLGYTVKFKGSAAKSFEKKLEETKSAGGTVRLFGLTVSVSGSSTKTSATHNGSWNSASGEFTVAPTADTGFATILAVVGEIVKTF